VENSLKNWQIKHQNNHSGDLAMLYKRWSILLRGYAEYYLNDSEEASSIVNDVFLQLSSQKNDIENIKGYLFKAVKNAALNQISSNKRKKIQYLESQDLAVLSDLSQPAVFPPSESAQMDFLQKTIAQLPQKRQLVFRMHRIEGFSYAQIAEFLQISHRTVEDHLAKSMKFIHEHAKHFFNEQLTEA
jgi:RNA polymerase sigma factor (sigma-70 family)